MICCMQFRVHLSSDHLNWWEAIFNAPPPPTAVRSYCCSKMSQLFQFRNREVQDWRSVLRAAFGVFLQYLQANIVPQIRRRTLPSTPFPVHYKPISVVFSAVTILRQLPSFKLYIPCFTSHIWAVTSNRNRNGVSACFL